MARSIFDIYSFDLYLRTGRLIAAPARPIHLKFNPWHDPDDGRFTFAGQGRYFAGGSRASETTNSRASAHAQRASRSDRTQRSSPYWRFDPENPRNHSVHVVQRGDTLTSLARRRKGLSVSDLASLNGLRVGHPLRVGQQLRLPNQTYLDAARAARNKFVSLAYYLDTHDGRLPPDSANPPSMAIQIEAQGVRSLSKNGYRFDIDVLSRTREVFGEIQLQVTQRSRNSQAHAGKPDRRATDDGGHYIAARFNGPRDWFNHFAQDANFNRGTYRALEDEWAKAIRSGNRVFMDIVPKYHDTSKRPYKLIVKWFVDGQGFISDFPNERQER